MNCCCELVCVPLSEGASIDDVLVQLPSRAKREDEIKLAAHLEDFLDVQDVSVRDFLHDVLEAT